MASGHSANSCELCRTTNAIGGHAACCVSFAEPAVRENKDRLVHNYVKIIEFELQFNRGVVGLAAVISLDFL